MGEEKSVSWKEKVVTVELKEGETSAVGSFVFENPFADEVVIENAATDCSCQQVAWTKGGISSKGNGSIRMEVDCKALQGLVEKHVIVSFSEGGRRWNDTLKMRISIPKIVICNRQSVFWPQGRANKEEIRVKPTSGYKVAFDAREASKWGFSTRLNGGRDGEDIIVLGVEPPSKRPARSQILVQVFKEGQLVKRLPVLVSAE